MLFHCVFSSVVRYGIAQRSESSRKVLTFVDCEWLLNTESLAVVWFFLQLKSVFSFDLITPNFPLTPWFKTNRTRQFILSIWVKPYILTFSIKINAKKFVSISQASKDLTPTTVRRRDWQPPPQKLQKNACLMLRKAEFHCYHKNTSLRNRWLWGIGITIFQFYMYIILVQCC